MKHLTIFAVILLSLSFGSAEDCGPSAYFDSHSCKFRCTPAGVEVDCTSEGCQCYNFQQFYNLDTKSCTEVNCDNMNCVGHENEVFYKNCQSSSRESCEHSRIGIALADCRTGCMCKDGYCRKNGKCVKI